MDGQCCSSISFTRRGISLSCPLISLPLLPVSIACRFIYLGGWLISARGYKVLDSFFHKKVVIQGFDFIYLSHLNPHIVLIHKIDQFVSVN